MSDRDSSVRFFYTGGALPPEAPSYISRSADEQLLDRLRHGDYCYILVSRQMGKSSLMVHTLIRLVQNNITALMVDLNSIGDDLTQEQWYYSLTEQLAGQLGLTEEIDAFWERSEGKTPLQKWVGALERLLRLHSDRSIVIFIDEIDQVRSLPFKTDQFFAAIRSFHNRRAMDADFKRLTFCLIGVALPSDLIEDPRITPFNIAERIDLTDFTEQQVLALKVGLQREEIQEELLLERVFYWTKGHPYLTQRLCQAIVEDSSIQTAQDVDTLCGRLFFGVDAATPDDNINLVSTRLLFSDLDIMGQLKLYQRIAQGKTVHYDRANRLINVLMLAGVIRSLGGNLQIRNRIYARVFDAKWIADNMPDAELRLQRQAYRRGVLRALSMASVVIAIMGVLLYSTWRSEKRARLSDLNSQNALGLAQQELYVANMSLAQKAYGEGNLPRVQQLLEECLNNAGPKAYHGFELRYLQGLIHQDRYTMVDQANRVLSVAFSPDGRTVVTVDLDATIRRWNVGTGNKIEAFAHQYGTVTGAAVSADAGIVGIATLDKMVLLHSSATGKVICRLTGFPHSVCALAFSNDGRFLAAGDLDGTVTLWRIAGGARLRTFPGQGESCSALAFSKDGKALFAAEADGHIWLRDVTTGRTLVNLKGNSSRILAASFSPDGRVLATGSNDNRVLLWDTRRGTVVRELSAHRNRVMAVTFSADGRTIATVSADTTAKLWNVSSGELLRSLAGHLDRIECVAFSPDGLMLATGSDDRSAKLWDLVETQTHHLGGNQELISNLAFAPDGRTVAVSRRTGPAVLWSLTNDRPLRSLDNGVTALAFAHNGSTLYIADKSGTLAANDVGRQSRRVLHPEMKAIRAIDLSPIANEAALAGEGGLVECIDTETDTLIKELAIPASDISEVVYSPKGQSLAISGKDGVVLVDHKTGSSLLTIHRAGAECCAFCFSPVTPELAVGFSDGTVEMWNITSATREWTRPGHIGHIYTMAFSPDGKNLVTGSEDHMVRIWNVLLKCEVWTLEGHRDTVCGLKFISNGRALVSIDHRGTAIVWQAPPLE